MRTNPTLRPTVSRWLWLCGAIILSCVHAASPSVRELIVRFQAEPMSWTQLDLADEIARVASLQDLAPLEPWLSQDSRHLRGNVAYLFAKLGDRRGFDTLVGILNDYSDRREVGITRGNCIRPSEEIETEEQIAAALKRCPNLLTNQIREDRYYAVHLFGRLRDPRAIDVLSPLLDHDEVNYNVAWALGEIGDERAIPALIDALSNKDALVRVSAIGALKKLKATQALPNLATLYDDTALPSAGERIPVGQAAREAAENIRRAK